MPDSISSCALANLRKAQAGANGGPDRTLGQRPDHRRALVHVRAHPAEQVLLRRPRQAVVRHRRAQLASAGR